MFLTSNHICSNNLPFWQSVKKPQQTNEHIREVINHSTHTHLLNMLGSKTLGTNVLELQFVLCWQTMIKTQSLGLGLFKVCLFVKLESSDCRTYWTKSARLD